jgi:hypothetical protein
MRRDPGMDRTVCHNEVCTSGSKLLKAAELVLMIKTDKVSHSHPRKVETWSVLKQCLCRITLESCCRSGYWCWSHLPETSDVGTVLTPHSLRTNKPHSQHVTVWSSDMSQQCFQSYNENITLLSLPFYSPYYSCRIRYRYYVMFWTFCYVSSVIFWIRWSYMGAVPLGLGYVAADAWRVTHRSCHAASTAC